jgi:hypothetical protein
VGPKEDEEGIGGRGCSSAWSKVVEASCVEWRRLVGGHRGVGASMRRLARGGDGEGKAKSEVAKTGQGRARARARAAHGRSKAESLDLAIAGWGWIAVWIIGGGTHL